MGLDTTQLGSPDEEKRMSRQSSLSNVSVSIEAATKTLTSKDLGLKFVTTKTKGWPKTFLPRN